MSTASTTPTTSASTAKKDRSPSFPFIPLGTAVDRLVAFEKYFGRHPAPAGKAGLAWGMKEKSSQADQTLAALRSFGFVVYSGSGSKREAAISEEGRRYLRAQQESVKEACLKQAALRPKIIRKFWATWGADRKPDPVALDELILDNGFSDNGARSFLKVYDDTVAFAKLSTADKIAPEDNPDTDEGDEEGSGENGKLPPLPDPPKPPADKVKAMAGERELTTGLLSKDANFRLLVSGKVGVKELERLIAKLELDKEILAEAEEGAAAETGNG
ncbi:MAG TPA: hypothetical protein VLC74_10695 [Rhizomicrobium sp.]|nr:hypothetical protein [Rhizomicrobium sp.]